MGQENTVGYRKLTVWLKSHELVLDVYSVTKKYPRDEMFGLVSQIRRASVSVPANIVEGYARGSKNELIQFLKIAIGSLAELEYYLELSYDLGYIKKEELDRLHERRAFVGKLLHGFFISVQKRNS